MIHMQLNLNREVLEKITFLSGSIENIISMPNVPSKKPFDNEIILFLNELSKSIMQSKEAKLFPEVITFAFWIRKASTLQLQKRFGKNDGNIQLGRGVVFHIAPSNVPVNYAYSLVTGLLTGNANIVRVPSKNFEQVKIINKSINEVISKFENIKSYITLIQYQRDIDINNTLSSIADVRIVWGGDNTINEIRKSPLHPRATDITFADRFSIAVIDSNAYCNISDKKKVAIDFYNDTYLTDQNACTSPSIVVWLGNKKEEAQSKFWSNLYSVVSSEYDFSDIQSIDKLVKSYLTAVGINGTKIINKGNEDNLVTVVKIQDIPSNLMDFKGNSGFFFEYEADDIRVIGDLCSDSHCQTIGYIGKKDMILPLVELGGRGIDRIVPIGKTMDFDLIWDGYDLNERLTREIAFK